MVHGLVLVIFQSLTFLSFFNFLQDDIKSKGVRTLVRDREGEKE